MRIEPPSQAESLRVVLRSGYEVWNVEFIDVLDRLFLRFRSGGTLYHIPFTAVESIRTHTAKVTGAPSPGYHDGSHPDCAVCEAMPEGRPW